MTEYAERDTRNQRHYAKHVSAMTGEKLHSKSAIAAELAHRDEVIDNLRAELAKAGPKWISVEYRLPETQTEIVFYASPYAWETGVFTPAGHCGQEDNVFQCHNHRGDDGYHTVVGVTHWMPLPKPPRTSGDN